MILIATYCITTQIFFGTVCPFAILTGFPCPACGLTRAGISLLTGHFLTAWEQNPSIYLWMLCALLFVLCRYVLSLKKIPCQEALLILVGIVTICVYLYRIVCGGLPEVPDSVLLPLLQASPSWLAGD
ncbi:MAG: DUF2752 domain-containing protein [Clostridiales bacterium]|nr:DUF2752 domain-containing protein [Clostridiales bacterium]